MNVPKHTIQPYPPSGLGACSLSGFLTSISSCAKWDLSELPASGFRAIKPKRTEVLKLEKKDLIYCRGITWKGVQLSFFVIAYYVMKTSHQFLCHKICVCPRDCPGDFVPTFVLPRCQGTEPNLTEQKKNCHALPCRADHTLRKITYTSNSAQSHARLRSDKQSQEILETRSHNQEWLITVFC